MFPLGMCKICDNTPGVVSNHLVWKLMEEEGYLEIISN